MATGTVRRTQPSASFLVHLKAILEVLKTWKELILLVVFFGSGVMWVVGYVATKQQVVELRCVALAQIAYQRATTDTKFLDYENLQKSIEIASLVNKERSLLSDHERNLIVRLQNEVENIKRASIDAENRRKISEHEINNGCTERSKK